MFLFSKLICLLISFHIITTLYTIWLNKQFNSICFLSVIIIDHTLEKSMQSNNKYPTMDTRILTLMANLLCCTLSTFDSLVPPNRCYKHCRMFVLVLTKAQLGLVCPISTKLFVFVSQTITVGLGRDHSLVWLGLNKVCHHLIFMEDGFFSSSFHNAFV